MSKGATFLGYIVAGAVGVAVGYSVGKSEEPALAVQKSKPDAPAAKTPTAAAKPASDEVVLRVPVTPTQPSKGPADALVTIVEFSDFECPFCSRVNPTLKQVQDTYGDKVRITWRHNPLPFHKNAPLAHEYSAAAGDQGKFWAFHDILFANGKKLQAEHLDGYAEQAGLDMAALKAYIASGKGKKILKEDQALAARVGARGTPNFFVNGVQLTGAQPFPKFKAVIDAQLAKAEALVSSGVPKAQVYSKLMASARAKAPPPKPRERPKQPPATRQKVDLVAGTPSKGGEQPLVTIIEWSDFECPFCSRANPTIAQILKTYGDKVQIQFRQQPLSFHKRAMPAAQASLAAHKQGKFWQYHDKLFENQKALQDADLERYAKELKLDVARFKKDMNSAEVTAQVKKDMADAAKFGARGTPTFFVNGIPVRGAQPFPNFKAVIDKEIALARKTMKSGVARRDVYKEILKREAGKAVGDAKPKAAAGPVNIKPGKAPMYGSKKAPVQVIIFSDFECPFCSRLNPSIEQIKKEYGDKVAVSFKHYPLPFHKNAELAGVASLAAHRQGKFWEYHDKLFENQKGLKRDQLVGYAKDLGLDASKFSKDLDDPSLTAWVKADMKEGSGVGVRGTPATFVNGRLVSGARPFASFKEVIDEELKKKKGKS